MSHLVGYVAAVLLHPSPRMPKKVREKPNSHLAWTPKNVQIRSLQKALVRKEKRWSDRESCGIRIAA